MWWDRSDLAGVYLSPNRVGLASVRAGASTWIETRDSEESIARLAEAFQLPALQSCGRIRVWLASALARPLMVSATSGARSRNEAQALAAMLAPDATGFDEPVRVWANAWRANRGGLAVVLPEGVWTALNRVVNEERDLRRRARRKDVVRSLGLVSVRPWWNHAIDAVISDSYRDTSRIGWSLIEGGGVVHGIVDSGDPVEVGFDMLGPHDEDGSLLRRRLQVNWDVVATSLHLDFAHSGGISHAPIGGWREAGRART